jgi:hypothetical protein
LLADDITEEIKKVIEGRDPLVALETTSNYLQLNVPIFIYHMQKDKHHSSKEELSNFLRPWADIVLLKPLKQFISTTKCETLKILE